MTELQTLIRDSNAMPPVIRADYLEDHGFDTAAAWLRLEGSSPKPPRKSTTNREDLIRFHACGSMYGVARRVGGKVVGSCEGSCSGLLVPFGKSRYVFGDGSGGYCAWCIGSAHGCFGEDFPDSDYIEA